MGADEILYVPFFRDDRFGRGRHQYSSVCRAGRDTYAPAGAWGYFGIDGRISVGDLLRDLGYIFIQLLCLSPAGDRKFRYPAVVPGDFRIVEYRAGSVVYH